MRQVCALCGRVGVRGFVILSGNGDGTRDSWCCASSRACESRRRREELGRVSVAERREPREDDYALDVIEDDG